jgi:predicted GNAT superfamily acetyltransferase
MPIRPLATPDDFHACLALQQAVWGVESDATPAAILKIAQRIGGIAAGAFTDAGELVGFIFGLTGVDHGETVHWSHQLAVTPEARNAGIGRRLKEYQRTAMEAVGVRRIYWTFDPLQAKNAHLNINRLGVEIVDYVEDMYAASRSTLFQGGTDRLVAMWDLTRPPRPRAAIANSAPDGTSAGVAPLLTDTPVEDGAPSLRIAIPLDIGAILRTNPDAATAWRIPTRRALQWALARGYRVDGLVRDDAAERAYYVLSRD